MIRSSPEVMACTAASVMSVNDLAERALSCSEDPLRKGALDQLRGTAQRQDGLERIQEAQVFRTPLPQGRDEGGEAVGELIVSVSLGIDS